MRRVMLLAFLALGLPAMASSIDFDTGAFLSGTLTGTFTTAIDVSVVGNLNTFNLDTGTLHTESVCPDSGATCFSFNGGSLTVSNGSSTVFSDTLGGGLIIKTGNGVALTAELQPNSMVGNGGVALSAVFSGNTLTVGTAELSEISPTTTATPEPGTLGLLGTGLISLAGIARRRLSFGI